MKKQFLFFATLAFLFIAGCKKHTEQLSENDSNPPILQLTMDSKQNAALIAEFVQKLKVSKTEKERISASLKQLSKLPTQGTKTNALLNDPTILYDDVLANSCGSEYNWQYTVLGAVGLAFNSQIQQFDFPQNFTAEYYWGAVGVYKLQMAGNDLYYPGEHTTQYVPGIRLCHEVSF